MSAATLCAVSPAAATAAPATRVRRSAVRAGLPPRDAAPGCQAVLYVPPRRFRLVASGAPAAVPHEVRVAAGQAFADTRIWARAAAVPRRTERTADLRRVRCRVLARMRCSCNTLAHAALCVSPVRNSRKPLLFQEPLRSSADDCSAALRTPTTALEIGRQLGGKGGGAAVLEKGGLDLRQSSSEFQAKTDDTGGDGGNGGKISNGGSGGDGDEGDDDDYFDDGDEEVCTAAQLRARVGCSAAPNLLPVCLLPVRLG